jgi:CSLREA domain-containing protein
MTVTTAEDVVAADGDVSLREAILAANNHAAVNEAPAGQGGVDGDGHPADTIRFSPVLAGQTITLNGTQLPRIDDALRIAGLGAEQLTIDAARHSRVFEIRGAILAEVSDLTITGGRASFAWGGAS